MISVKKKWKHPCATVVPAFVAHESIRLRVYGESGSKLEKPTAMMMCNLSPLCCLWCFPSLWRLIFSTATRMLKRWGKHISVLTGVHLPLHLSPSTKLPSFHHFISNHTTPVIPKSSIIHTPAVIPSSVIRHVDSVVIYHKVNVISLSVTQLPSCYYQSLSYHHSIICHESHSYHHFIINRSSCHSIIYYPSHSNRHSTIWLSHVRVYKLSFYFCG